jgi:hypothetical protein
MGLCYAILFYTVNLASLISIPLSLLSYLSSHCLTNLVFHLIMSTFECTCFKKNASGRT